MFQDFPLGSLENAKTELAGLIDEYKTVVAELKKLPNKTFANFIRPLADKGEAISVYFTPISHLNHVANSDETQNAYKECLALLTEFSTEQKQDEELAAAYREVEQTDLNAVQRKIITDALREFRLAGIGMPEEKKARIKAINMRLSEISTAFTQNLLNATNAFEMIVENEADVAELPESDKALAKTDGGWKFTLQMPSYLAYMTYGSNRELREKLYKAYNTRAPENGALIEELLALRTEKAQLLGFKSYAELSIERKSAPSPDKVKEFLRTLVSRAKKQGEQELNNLRQFAAERGVADPQGFDLTYFAEKLKKETLDYDEEKLRPYLEKDRVVNGLWQFLEQLFGIKFVQTETPVWDPTVTVYDLHRNGKVIGRLYSDLEARKNKKGGAWMNNWHTRHVDAEGNLHLPTAYIVGNFPPSMDGVPSLLKPSDVTTLFHEMGHALHHLCSTVDELDGSGINGVEWDAVEYPSQFLENFAEEASVLRMFAKHHKTGETMPEAYINKMIELKNFNSAMAMLRQVEFGLFDMLIHEGAYSEADVQRILNDVRKEVAVVSYPDYNKFQNGFAHIFGGGYSAGYYSYKWAELLSADSFFLFLDNNIFDKETAERFYRAILEQGGSRSMKELYHEFAGREADIEALLRLNGIAT